jgi:hypothetical protein
MILSAAQVQSPSYVPQTWHLYLTFLLLMVNQGIVSMSSTITFGRINVMSTVLNMVLVLLFVIWLPIGAIKKPK